jgi:formylglycine-generating enzyme required for sulfatase activity
MSTENQFVTTPQITLPNGAIIAPFQIGAYLCTRGEKNEAGVSPSDTEAPVQASVLANFTPWVSINYRDAIKACEAAGFKLVTELQYLAIAFDIAGQDINWTGGKVGEGKIYQGLHKDNVNSAQPGTFESPDANERRWHQLSNGARIYDFAGNAYSWVFDDVQGDEQGIVKQAFAENSASITTAPFPSMEKGVGWYPDADSDWSGRALLRGGYWGSEGYAGVFRLGSDWPGYDYDYVGFRCTK